jgi:hypothetical protein
MRKTRIPRSASAACSEAVRQLLNGARSWVDDMTQFRGRHSDNPHALADPLYAIPADLLAAIHGEIPDFFCDDELSFERDFSAVCQRHHAIGVFLSRPIVHSLLHSPVLQLSDSQLDEFGREWFGTVERAKLLIQDAEAQLDTLHELYAAFFGWLVSRPSFLSGALALRDRWEPVVESLGFIPAYPVRRTLNGGRLVQADGVDVTDEFCGNLDRFYEEWGIQALATWDLPVPPSTNLSGVAWPPSVGAAPPTHTFKIKKKFINKT